MYEIVVQTEYQDIYRLKLGVLIVVNKFIRDLKYNHSVWYRGLKKYNPKTQSELRVLKSDYVDEFNKYVIPKRTVIYQNFPVKLCDYSHYTFQIKTSGDYFQGDPLEFKKLMNEINQIHNTYIKV